MFHRNTICIQKYCKLTHKPGNSTELSKMAHLHLGESLNVMGCAGFKFQLQPCHNDCDYSY